MNFRIDVIRTSCKNNTTFSCLLQILQSFFSFAANVISHVFQFFPCSMGCSGNLCFWNICKFFYQTFGNSCLVGQSQERIFEHDGWIVEFVYIIFNILRIRGNNRTVVVVDGIRKFIPLVRNTGVENKFHTLTDQPGHMPVCQFCRITFRLAGNGFNSQLVNLPVGSGGEHYLIFQFCKETEPERIVLKHI